MPCEIVCISGALIVKSRVVTANAALSTAGAFAPAGPFPDPIEMVTVEDPLPAGLPALHATITEQSEAKSMYHKDRLVMGALPPAFGNKIEPRGGEGENRRKSKGPVTPSPTRRFAHSPLRRLKTTAASH
jgi:hypothetical protein